MYPSIELANLSFKLLGFVPKSNKCNKKRYESLNCKKKKASLDAKTNNGDKRQHKTINGDKRQHKCYVPGCGKMYAKLLNLQDHIRSHGGEKYSCKWLDCDKKFNWLSVLYRHYGTHTGEKKHVCHKCQKKFTRSDNLNRHLNTKHEKDNTICAMKNNLTENS